MGILRRIVGAILLVAQAIWVVWAVTADYGTAYSEKLSGAQTLLYFNAALWICAGPRFRLMMVLNRPASKLSALTLVSWIVFAVWGLGNPPPDLSHYPEIPLFAYLAGTIWKYGTPLADACELWLADRTRASPKT